jgi:nucleotide-binding universal stress UspA family protein
LGPRPRHGSNYTGVATSNALARGLLPSIVIGERAPPKGALQAAMHVRRILVPLSSARERPALEHALELAERLGAQVDILHVLRPPTSAHAELLLWALAYDPSHVEAERAVRRAFERLLASCNSWRADEVQIHFETGEVVDSILRFADRRGHDLIVIGVHSHSGLSRVLRSIAERLVQRSHCSVLAVPVDEPAPSLELSSAVPVEAAIADPTEGGPWTR